MLIFILHKREGVLQFYFFPVFSIPRGIYMLCFHVDVDFIVEILIYNDESSLIKYDKYLVCAR